MANAGGPLGDVLVSDGSDYPRKPKHRSECLDGPRPCPWVSCRYHLYLDIRADGVLRINFPDRDPHEMIFSCALDMANDGPRTLDQVAGLLGMSRERVRQIEEKVLHRMKRDERLGALSRDEDRVPVGLDDLV